MTDETSTIRLLLCYDGSLPAGAAIEAASRLLPGALARVAYLWTPPLSSEAMRRRLWRGTGGVNEFMASVEREGEAEAHRLAAMGVALAGAHGWQAEPVVRRTYGGEGLQLGEIAQEVDADLIVAGSRGLTGTRAILGSVSDMLVHYALCPVLVVPHPLLQDEHGALSSGPIVVGWDGSAGAQAAWDDAARLFPARHIVPVFAGNVAEDAIPRVPDLVETPLIGGHAEHGRAVAGALANRARAKHAAAIAVGSHGHSALHEILLGSVAMAVLHHAYRPVLIVPHRRATDD
jgi:nucleotide-binding universal stress UspA family protein